MRTAGWKITFFFSFMYIIFLIGEIVPCENIVHNNNSLLQILEHLLQIFALLFEINCTEIDQSQSRNISLCIIKA